MILEIIYEKKLVLSLGGGSILSPKIRKALKNNFLKPDIKVNQKIKKKRKNCERKLLPSQKF